MKSHKKIRWGIIGPGKIAHKFAEGLSYVNNAELYAVASRSNERAQAFAKQYRILQVYDSYESLVRDANVDVVYVATTNNMHYEQVKLCLEHGKACLCEKPFTCRAEELEELITMARAKNVFLMEAMWTRFLPSIISVDERIQHNEIGEILRVESNFGFTTEYDPNSRIYNPDLGGGALLDIGIYPVFFALHFLGMPVHIETDAIITELGVDSENNMVFYYDNSVKAELSSSFIQDLPCTATIYGTKGTITFERMWHCPTKIMKTVDGHEYDITPEYRGNGYNYEIEEVCNCLASEKKESLLMLLSESLQRQEILDKIQSFWNLKNEK
ncbi:MAG: Gfo/Idh/MocA family oxidoreductase [Bacteroidales bacterium]|jgi:predicted dehydrogenase|nr:Gfo/Idh/MocA family oxidoreductase [Bacteroidales bacterium]